MDFGKMIRDRRRELGLTLEQVGDIVGVGKSTVRKWEAGVIRNLRRDKIALLAQALQLEPVDLIDLGDREPAETIELTPQELELVRAYRSADDRAQADALYMLKSHPKTKEDQS